MLALSIRQPWAWLILNGSKDIENRQWQTRVRGRVLVHAAKGMTRNEYAGAVDFIVDAGMPPLPFDLPAFEHLQRGGIVGSVEIVDCVAESASPWFIGRYGFEQRKTGARLTVRWSPELRAVVERAKGLHGNVRALTLLHARRGKAVDYRTTRDQWERACEAAGVTDAHLHDLRAYALTRAKQQGLDATALAGHTSAAMTRRYLRDREIPLVDGPSIGRIWTK